MRIVGSLRIAVAGPQLPDLVVSRSVQLQEGREEEEGVGVAYLSPIRVFHFILKEVQNCFLTYILLRIFTLKM